MTYLAMAVRIGPKAAANAKTWKFPPKIISEHKMNDYPFKGQTRNLINQ